MLFLLQKGKDRVSINSENWKIAELKSHEVVLQINEHLFKINKSSFEGAKEIVDSFEKNDIFAIIVDVDTGNLEFWRKNDNNEGPRKNRELPKSSYQLLQERIRKARENYEVP